jgi:hypothetical protein
VVAWVVLVAAGCSLAGPDDPVTVVPPATAASRSSGPSPSGTAAAARELPSSGTLEADTYTRAGFEPGITFALDDGWSVGSVADGFFDVQQRSGTPDVIAVQFGRVGSVIGEGGTAERPASAEDAATRIAANPGLETLDQSDSRLGGLTGVVVEVENDGGEHAPILDVPAGRLGIDPGRRLWIALFDTADGLLAVMVGGPTDGWEDALRIAEPVLESIVIDG